MSKADYKIEGTVPRELLVSEVRKAARQFAMQFFHCEFPYKSRVMAT